MSVFKITYIETVVGHQNLKKIIELCCNGVHTTMDSHETITHKEVI